MGAFYPEVKELQDFIEMSVKEARLARCHFRACTSIGSDRSGLLDSLRAHSPFSPQALAWNQNGRLWALVVGFPGQFENLVP